MKAIVAGGGGLELREIETPVPAEGGVLVRVRAASLNAADWHMTHGIPRLIGTALGRGGSAACGVDLAGTIEAVGSGVTRFQPGDEVFGVARGSFAEYAATPEDRLAPKPRGMTFEQAAALPVAGCTALQGLRDKGQLRSGQRALIYGAGGGVGTYAVQVAHGLGAHVTAVTRTENLELMRNLGADEVVDYTREDFTRRGQRYDLLLDIGANRSSAEYRSVLTAAGKVVLAGAPPNPWVAVSRLLWMMMKPRAGGRRIPFLARVRHDDLVELKQMVEDGRLRSVIDREVPLDEVPAAIRYLGTGQARGKVVVRIA